MSKHTPGDWYVCDTADEPDEFCTAHRPASVRSKAWGESDLMGDYRGVIVCTFEDAHGNRPHSFAECYANARLVAAAPDLLAALRGLCQMSDADEFPGEADPRWKAARAAIAKALGC